MTNHQVDRHGRALLQAVQRGLQAEPIHPPHNIRPEKHFLERVEAIKTMAETEGAGAGG